MIKIGTRRWLLSLFLLVLLVPTRPHLSVEGSSSAAIISNSIDFPAAQKLKEYLESQGYDAEIRSPEEFWNLVSKKISPIFILGGPDAYEGIGDL